MSKTLSAESDLVFTPGTSSNRDMIRIDERRVARIDTLTSRINCLEAENQLLRDQVQALKKNRKNSSLCLTSTRIKGWHLSIVSVVYF
jgi:hypothetical protein